MNFESTSLNDITKLKLKNEDIKLGLQRFIEHQQSLQTIKKE